MVSHDWPRGIERHGDLKYLLECKKHFKPDIDKNCLGSPPYEKLLKSHKPSYWLSAHMHIRFEAFFYHKENLEESSNKKIKCDNPDEINLSSDSEPENKVKVEKSSNNQCIIFLNLS